MHESLKLTLCEIQAKLFELSKEKGYDSEAFIKAFMKSDTARGLDKPFHHMQWAGEHYLMSRLDEENADDLVSGYCYDTETLYWIGYIYRYWHIYKGESSKMIYKQAPAKMMRTVYLMYHTMSPEMAIDRLQETYSEAHKK